MRYIEWHIKESIILDKHPIINTRNLIVKPRDRFFQLKDTSLITIWSWIPPLTLLSLRNKSNNKSKCSKNYNSPGKSKTRVCDMIVDLSIILLLKYYFVIHGIQQRKSIKKRVCKKRLCKKRVCKSLGGKKTRTLSKKLHFFQIVFCSLCIFNKNNIAKQVVVNALPAGIYLLRVNNRNNRTRCEICSKLTMMTPSAFNL